MEEWTPSVPRHESGSEEAEASATREFYYKDTIGNPVPVAVNPGINGTRFEYSGPPDFILFEKRHQVEGLLPVLRSRLNPRYRNFLLVDIDRSESAILKLVAIPTDRSVLSDGTILAVNLGDRSFFLSLAEAKSVELKPKRPLKIEMPDTKDSRFKVTGSIRNGDTYKMRYRRTWYGSGKDRKIVLFFPTNRTETRWNNEIIHI